VLRLFLIGIVGITSCIGTHVHAQDYLHGHKLPIWSVAFSRDGRFICSSGEDGLIIVWDLEKRKQRKVIEEQDDHSNAVLFAHPGRVLSARSTVKMWSLEKSQLPEVIFASEDAGVKRGVALSASGRLLATGGAMHTVKTWDIQARKESHSFKGHSENISSVAFAPNEKLLASGSFDGSIRVWDLDKNEQIASFFGYENMIRPIVFFPDNKRLTAGSWDGTVKVWNLATGRADYSFRHDSGTVALDYCSRTSRLVIGCLNREVHIYDMKDGKRLTSFKHSTTVQALALSPDGKMLAVGGNSIGDNDRSYPIQLYKMNEIIEGK
jgi:WD40 repeat protein